jgi:hypothetical protein
MKKLTERQVEVVKLIFEGQKKGLTPTLAELAEKLHVSSRQTVKDLLDAIAKKGYLVRKPRRARAIMLKEEAINEIEKGWQDFLSGTQLKLNFSFAETTDQFQWCGRNNNIVINYGKPSTLAKIIIDSSDIVLLKNQDGDTTLKEVHSEIQFIAEKTNFDNLYDSTGRHFIKNYDPLVITPIMPNPGEGGYVIPDNHQLYDIAWSGVTSSHHFRFGMEYGSTEKISYVDMGTNQIQLLEIPNNTHVANKLIQKLRIELKSWSQYVDYPIYGGALKKNGEVLFWSRSTARDINDLRYIFLVDITKTSFQGSDKILMRDISHNFPKYINNSTQ